MRGDIVYCLVLTGQVALGVWTWTNYNLPSAVQFTVTWIILCAVCI